LAADPSNIPLSLYVHLPWCERKCPYCDFNSHENFDVGDEDTYIAALLRDLEQQESRILGRKPASIFIGGGTPSLFSGPSIARLLEGINRVWGIDKGTEITLEANPGSAEVARFKAYRDAGVSRVSIGVQSFDNQHLARLGRIHQSDQAKAAIAAATSIFSDWNIDLMHGLPEQTVEQAIADIATAIAFGGTHISWYQLTIERNTRFWSNPPLLPEEDELTTIQETGASLLGDSGFAQYEVSAWAREGRFSQHNMNYWEFGDYLGIGAGAHGKLTTEDGQVIRTQRTRLPKDYLSGILCNMPTIDQAIPPQDLAAEFMMNALRLRGGVDVSIFSRRTGQSQASLEPARTVLQKRGLLTDAGARLQTTQLGYRFLNSVSAEFLAL
jgi:putative oxygen-independent coproporphyrinogen III oxidase